ncbi:phage terminase large subunit [uncultured Halomonas sp.]|uniref:PBSX family phage terminase large subunit n=1 Tax=uncultured Halomonas sp. TaxID=173971 RepID=UPI0026039949|nr:phage terminase large subunit [uncultured Halomonas sp.]
MTTRQVKLPPKLVPVFATPGVRYRGAYGGRGSGKTRSFAKMAAIRGYQLAMEGNGGLILCAREFMNSLDESSMSEVKAAIQSEPWLAAHYDIGEKYIRTRDKRIEFAFAGLRHNLDSLKSKARIHILWVDEAEPVSETAWLKAIPTVREHGSEIWLTWNPESDRSATHQRFRVNPPDDAVIVELNWRDNPWFPDVLNQERLEDKAKRPDQYDHVWEGDFVRVVEGAYYAELITQARLEGRIGKVQADPYLPVKVFTDIGGTGAKSDAFSMWVAQFVAREVRVIDYYEAQGQPFAAHLAWLRRRGYGPQEATITLPHDGATHDRVIDVSYESAFREVGYSVTVIPNQGRGAAAARIEALRRLFPSMWFNETTTKGGLDALGWYHEKIDDRRGIGLGPEHDWSSHGADAAGLMAVAYEPPRGAEPESFEPDFDL